MVMFRSLGPFSLPSLLAIWAIWAVLRFGAAGAGGAMLLIAVTGLLATAEGQGPFVRAARDPAEGIMRLLVYLGTWSAFFQIVAAILEERARAVTGLARLNQDLERRVEERTESLTVASAALAGERRALPAGGFGRGLWRVRSPSAHRAAALDRGDEEDVCDGARCGCGRGWDPGDAASGRPRAGAAGLPAFARSAGSGVLELEHRVLLPDGEERWLRVSGRTLFEPGEPERVPVRALGTCIDITEQKRVEQALRESENRLALAVKAGHSGTYDWDIKTNRNHWSDDLLELYGIASQEFGGQYEDWTTSVLPDDLPRAEAAVKASFVTGQFSAQFRIRRRDTGEVRWMEARGTLLTDNEGKPARLLGINVDITDQKRVELALRESEQRPQPQNNST